MNGEQQHRENRRASPDRSRRGPSIWLGCGAGPWFRMLARGRWKIVPARVPEALLVSVLAPFNSLLGWIDKAVYRRHADPASIARPPLFVIGHWRSGTTLLHDLLSLDPQHQAPTTYQCFAPAHFRLTQGIIPPLLAPTLPRNRLIDAMPITFDSPQEDEFALCLLGVPSSVEMLCFPRLAGSTRPLDRMDLWPAPLRERWTACLVEFLARVQGDDHRRIVLKSPTHSYRVRWLLELFPDARFVHIVRDPRDAIPSTMRMLRTMVDLFGMQRPPAEDDLDGTLERARRLFDAIARDRPAVPAGQFTEVRYEDLVADMVGTVHGIYDDLGLGGFAATEPALREEARRRGTFRRTPVAVDEARDAAIEDVLRDVLDRHGYPRRRPGNVGTG